MGPEKLILKSHALIFLSFAPKRINIPEAVAAAALQERDTGKRGSGGEGGCDGGGGGKVHPRI